MVNSVNAYDVIVFGDEIYGVLAAVAAAREYRRRTKKYPYVLLITSNRFSAPIFNIGIKHALIKDVPNLAVIGPGSGFEGYACSAGRIVEFNVAVGGGVGIATIIALLSGKDLADISNQEVRQVLAATNQLPKIYGISNMAEATRLEKFESVVV